METFTIAIGILRFMSLSFTYDVNLYVLQWISVQLMLQSRLAFHGQLTNVKTETWRRTNFTFSIFGSTVNGYHSIIVTRFYTDCIAYSNTSNIFLCFTPRCHICPGTSFQTLQVHFSFNLITLFITISCCCHINRFGTLLWNSSMSARNIKKWK